MNERGQTGIAGVDYSMTCPCVCVFKYDFIDKFKFDYAVDDGASPADAYAKLKTLDLFADATDV